MQLRKAVPATLLRYREALSDEAQAALAPGPLRDLAALEAGPLQSSERCVFAL